MPSNNFLHGTNLLIVSNLQKRLQAIGFVLPSKVKKKNALVFLMEEKYFKSAFNLLWFPNRLQNWVKPFLKVHS